ncbi:MAG: hypothetical protein WA858_02825, partial [Xanthobacteraceae bacterium]
MQSLVSLGVGQDKLTCRCSNHINLGQNAAASHIGMNETPICIDEEYRDAQTVEGLRKCRCLVPLKVDDLGNKNRASDMR